MSETKTYSLLLGGLLHAADTPGFEQQVVPAASDIQAAARSVLQVPIMVGGGDRDPSVNLGLGGDPNYIWTTPRRYSVEVHSEIPAPKLYDGLVHALLDVAPLPSGVASDWTVRIALENGSGERIADRTWQIQRGGGRRRLLSPSGMGGIALGGLVGAWLGGPVGVVIGAPLGQAAGEALERLFPSTPTRSLARSDRGWNRVIRY